MQILESVSIFSEEYAKGGCTEGVIILGLMPLDIYERIYLQLLELAYNRGKGYYAYCDGSGGF